jgi:hypothetical protein
MPQDNDRPRPHGDPLQDVVEENQAQQQSDASPDVVAGRHQEEIAGTTDRDEGRGSTANGIPEFDEDAGKKRREQYEKGAGLVSGID